jgi:hypothetical protein
MPSPDREYRESGRRLIIDRSNTLTSFTRTCPTGRTSPSSPPRGDCQPALRGNGPEIDHVPERTADAD